MSQLTLVPCYWKRCVLGTYFLAEAWCPGPFLFISLLYYNSIFSSLKMHCLEIPYYFLETLYAFILILLIMYTWEERVHESAGACWGQKRALDQLMLHAVLSYSNKWWEQNSDPLQEQYVLLTAEWSLHPHWEGLFSASFPDHSFILFYNITLYYSSPSLYFIIFHIGTKKH